MYVPRARERVQIIGRSGVFLVVRVDDEQQAADLLPLHFAIYIEEGPSPSPTWSLIGKTFHFQEAEIKGPALRSRRISER